MSTVKLSDKLEGIQHLQRKMDKILDQMILKGYLETMEIGKVYVELTYLSEKTKIVIAKMDQAIDRAWLEEDDDEEELPDELSLLGALDQNISE